MIKTYHEYNSNIFMIKILSDGVFQRKIKEVTLLMPKKGTIHVRVSMTSKIFLNNHTMVMKYTFKIYA